MSEGAAVAIWNELLAGEWVVVERRDAEARRTIVLRRATAGEREGRAFTSCERAVVRMAMRAWSLKMMAAELGLGISRVAEILGRVRAKLGAPTHADFLRMVGSLGLPAATPRDLRARAPLPSSHPLLGEKSLRKRTFAPSMEHL